MPVSVIATVDSCSPRSGAMLDNVGAGPKDGDGDADGLCDADGLIDADDELDGLREADGLTDADAELDGLTDALIDEISIVESECGVSGVSA